MKKVLSLVLAIMMVLSLTTVAFAETTFSDIDAAKEAELAAAVSLASSLGIIDGFPDGTFGPEKGVTRAQMAKMLVIAKGWEQIASGVSTFSDTKGHWAEGFIALATELGIIDGYPDGSFKPDAPVSYTHAVVMMMRTLGYTNESLNGGRSTAYNEAAYKTKGLSLGLFDVMPSSLTAPANRGDIALMIQTLLQCYMVETNENGRPESIGRTLITELAPVHVKEFEVTPDTLTEGHLVDLLPYMFQTLDVYMNEEGIVLYVNFSRSVVGKIATVGTDFAVTAKIGTKGATLTGNTKITIDNLFYNGAIATTVNSTRIKAGVPVILTKDYDDNGEFLGTFHVAGVVINKADAAVKVANVYKTGVAKLDAILLAMKDGKINLDAITVVGAATTLEDIAVNDVVQAYQADGRQATKLVVTRESVSGKVTKLDSANGVVFVDGKEYGYYGVSPVPGKEYTYLLDKDGYIAFELTEEEAPQAINYGLIISGTPVNGAYSSSDEFGNAQFTITKAPRVMMLMADGKSKAFDVVVPLDRNNNIAEGYGTYFELNASVIKNNLFKNTVIAYSITEDGKLSINLAATKALGNGKLGTDLEPAKASFLGNDSTVYFVKDVAEKYGVVKKSALAAKFDATVYGDATIGWPVLFIDAYVAPEVEADTMPKYGVLVKAYTLDQANGIYEYVVLVDGQEVTYTNTKVTNSTTAGAIESVVKLDVTKDTNELAAMVDAVDEGSVELKADENGAELFEYTESYLLVNDIRVTFASNMTVYTLDADGNVVVGSLSDLVVGKTITVYLNEFEFVEVITVQ